jgi:hypothetical protein
MTCQGPRTGQRSVCGPAALARVGVYLLCTGALLGGTQARAQGLKGLPDVNEAIPTTPPTPEQLFRLESEAALRQRMIQEARRRKLPAPLFPADPKVEEEYIPRNFPPMVALVEPSYVCYGRLYFEQRNAERYGWDFGPVHPLVALGVFYFDVATLPYHLGTDPHRRCECSAGYCLPGDPVPLLLYPAELSLTGVAAEAAVIGAGLAIFP